MPIAKTVKVRAAASVRVPFPRGVMAPRDGRPFVLEPGETADVPASRYVRGRVRAGDLELAVVLPNTRHRARVVTLSHDEAASPLPEEPED